MDDQRVLALAIGTGTFGFCAVVGYALAPLPWPIRAAPVVALAVVGLAVALRLWFTPWLALPKDTRAHYRIIISGLPGSQKAALRQMLITGHARDIRAHDIPPSDWGALVKAGLVYSDVSGPKGIKPELRALVRRYLQP